MIKELRELDIVKQLEAEGFTVHLVHYEELNQVHFSLSKGNLTSSLNKYQTNLEIDLFILMLNIQKDALTSHSMFVS
ncbi:hypothetical protein EZY14_009395 [Kordia sp. TARA_039_SRF]|nr:hypothetical protein EZY14_009395 [Kordia sp. TARA_039_SRF]